MKMREFKNCAKRSENYPLEGVKKFIFFCEFVQLIARHWIIKNRFFEFVYFQIVNFARWNVTWMDSVRNCADLVNKRWKRYAFSEFIRISRKNKKKYPFIEVFILRIYLFFLKIDKKSIFGAIYTIFYCANLKLRENIFFSCANLKCANLCTARKWWCANYNTLKVLDFFLKRCRKTILNPSFWRIY